MVRSVLRHSLQTMNRVPLRAAAAPQRRALANARAAVDRDRRAALRRSAAEAAGDFDSLVALLALDPAA